MKVKDLIAELSKMNLEANIHINSWSSEPWQDITNIEVLDSTFKENFFEDLEDEDLDFLEEGDVVIRTNN